MTHIKGAGSRSEKVTPIEWLKVGAQIGKLANTMAGRGDIVAFVGEGAGGDAPACFYPASAELEINIETAFGVGANPKHIDDLNKRKNQYEYPKAVGMIAHEAFHARFTRWDMEIAFNDLEKDEKVYGALTLLEESRIEFQGLNSNKKILLFLRSMATDIVADSVKENAMNQEQSSTTALTNIVGLIYGRIDAGILDADEMTEITDWLDSHLPPLQIGRLRKIARQFQRHTNHGNATDLYPLAKEWVEIVNEIADERGDKNDEEGNPIPMSAEMLEEFLEMLGNAGIEIEIANFGELLEQENVEKMEETSRVNKERADEKATNKDVATKIFMKNTGTVYGETNSKLVSERAPTAVEHSSAVRIGQMLDRAKYRERDSTERASDTPPGRMRGRSIVQNEAMRSRGAMTTEKPFRKTMRRQTDEPTLSVGIMVDISGSMGSAMLPMATTAWVMSEAVNRIQGKCAMVYYGTSVFPVLRKGQRLPKVKVYSAPDGTEKFNQGFQALDGALDLLYGRGARLLVIVSDGVYTDEETTRATEIMKKCEDTGVAVLWLTFDSINYAKGISPNYAEIVGGEIDPKKTADIIGGSAMKVLNKVAQRRVA